jgi:hypothetical protein
MYFEGTEVESGPRTGPDKIRSQSGNNLGYFISKQNVF